MNVQDFVSFTVTNVSSDEGGCQSDKLATWETHGGVLVYIFVLLIIFYLMEVICDEFFVPALNILCEKLKMSDDVAGATFMAAGASSPELFVSLVGVLSNSPVGIGTVVGSELFNMLCICGGSALVASCVLELEWRILAREVLFYAFSIVLLLIFLGDKKVQLWEAFFLVGSYSVYIFVCSTYDKIVGCCCPFKVEADLVIQDTDSSLGINSSLGATSTGQLEKPLLPNVSAPPQATVHDRILRPSIQQNEREDSGNARSNIREDEFSLGHSSYEAQLTLWDARQATSLRGSLLRASVDSPHRKRTEKVSFSRKKKSKSRINAGLGFPEEYEETNMRMHGFLFKKSRFYSKASITSKAWQRRWFMLKKNGTQLRYCRNPLFPSQNLRIISLINVEKVQVDSDLDLLLHSPEQTYQFRARDTAARNAWRDALTQQIATIQLDKSRGRIDESTHTEEDDFEDHPELLALPDGNFSRFVFVVVFPIIFCWHYTIPDPRRPRWTKWYPLTLLFVVIWLAGMSYVLVKFADKMGCILDIKSDLIGLTIGSIGTSLPNLFASMLVAKQGLGNMAISNAFGSNVFNIFMALGIPWLIATLILDVGKPYKVNSSSIKSTVILLAAFLILFILVMGYFRWKLTRNIGKLFIVLYLIFIVYMALSSYDVLPSMS